MEERSQPATARRRDQYRARGDIAQSRELSGAAVILAVTAVIMMAGGSVATALLRFCRLTFGDLAHLEPAAAIKAAGSAFVAAAGPLLLTAMASAVAIALLQTRGNIASEAFGIDINRLNPLPRLQQLFTPRTAAVGIGVAFLKVIVIGAVAYTTIRGRLPVLLSRPSASLGDAMRAGADLVGALALRIGILMLAVGAADYGLNWFRLEQRMRMSHDEVREEMKDDLGNPQVRSRRRRRMRELMRQRSLRDVPKSDVVVTNPTHFAVALVYRSRRMGAPRVVAKGTGPFALRIREIARRSGVAVVEQPPLARALFARVPVGREVPAELYKAVAILLAHVYRLRRRRA
jgi:flagellar biosynthesis protein FlhB